jgi:glycosyltransferase involved in cell wall biosynthesis
MTRPSEETEDFVQSLEECTGASTPPVRSFLNWEEVRVMQQGGISFGSHTLHHTLLRNSSPRATEIEIRLSREELIDRLGAQVGSFSYPWGVSNALLEKQARESGYSCAVTVKAGIISSETNPWLVPRIAISNSMLRNSSQKLDPGRAQLSFAKNVVAVALSRLKRTLPTHSRIRIAFLIDQIDGWEGGTERHLHTLLNKLDRKYFDPELICNFRYAQVPAESFPCPVHFICAEDKRLSGASTLVRLVRLLRRIRPDIVQTYFPESNTLGIVAARLANVRVSIGTSRNLDYRTRFRDQIALRLAGKLAKSWQCNSQAVSEYVLDQFKMAPEKIEILPNAVDLSRFTPFRREDRAELRRQLGLNANGPIVVSVANLRPVKDLATLIAAARLVHVRLPAAQFVIVGEGPLCGQLQQQVSQASLTGVVRLVGLQSDVLPYLASADVGVLTSHSEGSSNSVLEYMAMGLPTVVSDIPPNRELVEGVFFVPGDVASLAEALVELWRDPPTIQRLAERNHRAALQYGVEELVRRAEGYYNRLVPATY